MKKISLNLEENILILLSLIMTWGALIYYLYRLSILGVIVSLLLSAVSFYYLRNKTPALEENSGLPQKSWPFVWWPIGIYFMLVAWSFLILLKNSSAAALISPWSVLPKSFFIIFFLASGWLFYVLNRNIKKSIKINLLRLHYLLAFSVAAIIYKIGYGFDPFIHQATMELIDKKGLVLPKPFYYLGEYSLVVIFHKISGVSIYFLNKFLVPVLAAIFIPGAVYKFLNEHGSQKRAFLSILSLLALPLNLFILSTPQNLSYLWLLLLIIYAFTSASLNLKSVLALATISLHPLSGLPAIFFIIWLELIKRKKQLSSFWYKFLSLITWLACSLSLPLAFTIISKQSWRELSFVWPNLGNVFNFAAAPSNRDNILLNFLYLLANNWLLVFIALTIFGWLTWYKRNKQEALLLFKITSALLFGFILSSSLSFNFLIDYERGNYSARLPILIALFAMPALIISLDYLANKIWRSEKVQLISTWILISILLTSSLYLSYPRLDAYVNSKGYSVSEADLQAVRLINNQSTEKYIVLANQQTSVAALKELGFDHYYKNGQEDIFFYPIPTGGSLYQYYLNMVNEKPDQKIMRAAMNLAGVKESYFVVNKYWTNSNRLIAEAKLQADKFWLINNGDIYIFQYKY